MDTYKKSQMGEECQCGSGELDGSCCCRDESESCACGSGEPSSDCCSKDDSSEETLSDEEEDNMR